MAKASKISTGPTDKPQDRRLQERELRAREEELRQVMAIYELASKTISDTFVSLKEAVRLLEHMQYKCDNSPVLRSAMISRFLAVKAQKNDAKIIYGMAQKLAKSIHHMGVTYKLEAERIIQNPELLR